MQIWTEGDFAKVDDRIGRLSGAIDASLEVKVQWVDNTSACVGVAMLKPAASSEWMALCEQVIVPMHTCWRHHI